MDRSYQILWINQSKASKRWVRFLAGAPAKWRFEWLGYAELLGRPEALASADALVVELQSLRNQDDPEVVTLLNFLRIAREAQDTLPVVCLLSTKLPAGDRTLVFAKELNYPYDRTITVSDVRSGQVNLQQVISESLRSVGRVANTQAVLVTHGTDTMAWAFAYLRYALSGLTMNLAMTGSQLPLEGTFYLSDALGNLRTSVYLLNRLAPGKLFLVFNEGRHIYSGSLNKIRKWDQNAFDGKLAGAVGAEWVDFFDQDWISIAYSDQKLEQLHLIRTGGTIESAPGAQGSLAPTADFVKRYLCESLNSQFTELVDHVELEISRDSSNIALEDWEQLARLIAQISGCACDTRFSGTVKVVYANPFMTAADYLSQFDSCQDGVVLAGFGAGNANTLEASGRSVLPAIRAATQAGKLVVLSSQVALESYDMDYQVGRELVQAGGLPCGDLSLADAQVKLSYLTGHRAEFDQAAKAFGLSTRQLIASAFLAGVKLRKKTSRTWLVETLVAQGCRVHLKKEDPFEGQSFAKGLQEIIDSFR